MIKLNIDGFKSAYVAELSKTISELSDYEGVINARMVDSEEIKRLNREYAGKDEATDVLSFSYIENTENGKRKTESGPPFSGSKSTLGDIVISRSHVKQQARAAGTNEETEFILLLLHGALHILGHDHHRYGEREKMDKLQRRIMLDLGLPYRAFGWQT